MVSLANGVEVVLDNKLYLLDSRRTMENAINLVSHGHHDHLPTKYESKRIICSKETASIIKLRRNKEITRTKHVSVKSLDAGHSPGSRMFLINKSVLYTGDFNTVRKYCGQAKPKKCDTLIIDSTFGHPKYAFPSYKSVVDDFIDYMNKNEKVFISSYSFGKSQEIQYLLNKNKIPFNVTDPIRKTNEAIGMKFKHYDPEVTDVMITHSSQGAKDYKRIALSGWAMDNFYKYALKLDRSFILSDHAGFDQILDFVDTCNPRQVYTLFGFATEMAQAIRKRLKIDAQPLLKNQSTLSNFIDDT